MIEAVALCGSAGSRSCRRGVFVKNGAASSYQFDFRARTV